MTLRRRMRRDLERDIQEHIEMETRDNLERGMSPEEARYAALRKFGNVTLVQEHTRAAWGWTRLERVGQDARYSLRAMRRNPIFTMIAVLTLGLGIGMNTAVFSVVNAVLITPIPYPNPDRLVWLATHNQVFKMEAVGGADFLDWRDQAQSFEAMAAYGFSDATMSIGEDSDKVTLAYPTAELWAITGAQPALGRFFSASDRDVLVLTHALFERRFGGDPGAIGKTVMLDGRPAAIIGVLPREFRFVPQSVGAPGIDAKEIEAYAPSTISRANQTRAGGDGDFVYDRETEARGNRRAGARGNGDDSGPHRTSESREWILPAFGNASRAVAGEIGPSGPSCAVDSSGCGGVRAADCVRESGQSALVEGCGAAERNRDSRGGRGRPGTFVGAVSDRGGDPRAGRRNSRPGFGASRYRPDDAVGATCGTSAGRNHNRSSCARLHAGDFGRRGDSVRTRSRIFAFTRDAL